MLYWRDYQFNENPLKYAQIQEENGQATIFVLDERMLLTNQYGQKMENA